MEIEEVTLEDGTVIKRTRCEVYTRCMGYHRPISNFNYGKKAEYYNRKCFKETDNKLFAKEFV